MGNKIIIFTLNGCEYCLSLKQRLNELSIPFNEIDVDNSNEIWEQVVDEIGDDYVPVTLVYDDNEDGVFIVPDRDYKTEDELIKIIQSYL
jgi:glutaredoxin